MASPSEMTEMFDGALLGILQHVGNIQDFLQIYFGFLYRKTDFYQLMSGPGDKLGFPPGMAEMIVHKTFKLFEKVAEHDRERQLSQKQKTAESRCVLAAAQELEVTTELHKDREQPRSEEAKMEEACSVDAGDVLAPAASALTSNPKPGIDCSSSSSRTARVPRPSGQGNQAADISTNSEETQEKFQSDADSFNGAVRENYSWSQDYTDVEVHVFVPKAVVKGQQVQVSLQSSSVKVCVSDGTEVRTLMEGELTHKINTENSVWSLEPGRCVNLSLNKTSDVWWSAVLRGEKEIDVNQINRERSMETVTNEEHAVLDKLMLENHQKMQRKVSSY
ncbi:nudC domain-containing protein 3-like [Cynoglossus semilaevis]|uniref:nudC domain-containing protein 3-like n=1 Tax=Cynoglossus semilaevis TaxID=244447 RepID=UPI000496A4BD|nr:nudC domain-containing protein 3-like [Cynoglossus semilaevis]